MNYATRYWDSVSNLRKLTLGNSILHRVIPAFKFVIILFLIIFTLGQNPYSLDSLFYPLACLIVFAYGGNVPWKFLFSKFVLAFPFVFFIGLSNLIFDRQVLPGTFVTTGMLSCISVILKTFLSVGLITVFVATTTREEILHMGRQFHLPEIFLLQLDLTLRYVGVLVEETGRMYRAYHLRQPNVKFIKLSDMGTFLGLLLLRTLDRAERVYQAMECRGYGIKEWKHD